MRWSACSARLLIVTMGLFVMGIVFAMLLPIFELNNLIH